MADGRHGQTRQTRLGGDGRPARGDRAAASLPRIGSEFRAERLETTFNWARHGETITHPRWLLIAPVISNMLFPPIRKSVSG